MDITKLSIAKLKQLQNRIPEELKKRQSTEKKKLQKELAALAAAKGFTLADFTGKIPKPSEKPKARKPVAVKYRHPENASLAWTGRGRKPLWVVEWLAKGKSIASLAV